MDQSEMEIMPRPLPAVFQEILDGLDRQVRERLIEVIGELDVESLSGAGKYDYESPAVIVGEKVRSIVGEPDAGDSNRLRAGLIAELAVGMPSRLPTLNLPATVLELYPRTMEMIADHLRRTGEHVYPSDTDDAFVKDVRLLLGLSVPAGAQAVDLCGGVRPRSLVKHALTTLDIKPLKALFRSAMSRDWFSIHTDSRDLLDFNEAGWEQCYLRIGALFQGFPSVAGVVGTSWFYDPQLIGISPRLGYLQKTPMENGAVRIRNGPGEIHTQRATATSGTRRRLVEEGKYIPVCYTIAWPREDLLRWCSRREPN